MKMKNKKGQVGREWIFGLAFLFALTVLYLTFNIVFNVHLAPIILDIMPATDAGVQAEAGINSWLNIWTFAPYILFGITLIYLIILAVKKEPVEREF